MSDTQTEMGKLRVKAAEEERKNAGLGAGGSNVGQAVKVERADKVVDKKTGIRTSKDA